ncbi:MAG TPA: hypothetical protein ENK02_07845 [Planctomycetes bacterium]|nr:hypothetical protein [Planctomycetota bacterium]
MMQYPRSGYPLVPHLLRELFGRMEVPPEHQHDRYKSFSDLDETVWDTLGEEVSRELAKKVIVQMQSRLSTIPKVIRQRPLPKIPADIEGKDLPFSNRTRLSLEREGLLDRLHLLSGHPIQAVLEFRAFGGKCLLDFLTILEKTLRDHPEGLVPMEGELAPIPEPPLPNPKKKQEKKAKKTRAQGVYPREGDPLAPKMLREIFQNKALPEGLDLGQAAEGEPLFKTFADLDQRVWEHLSKETCEELAAMVAKRIQSRFSTLPKVIRNRRLPKIPEEIHLHHLPLTNRTFLSLERELQSGSLAPLSGKTISELLQFRAFGGKCLLDFLSVLQKTLEAHPEGWQEVSQPPLSADSQTDEEGENATGVAGEELAEEMVSEPVPTVFDPKRARISPELSSKFENPPLKVFPRVGFPLIPEILRDMFVRTKIPERLGVHDAGYKVLSDLDTAIWEKFDPETCEALGKLVIARVQSRLSTIPKALRLRRLPIFPKSLRVKDLPLMNRTKLSLEREGHVNTFNKLSGKKLQTVLEFKAFGGKCLLDLLTLFDATLIPLDEAPPELLETREEGLPVAQGESKWEVGGSIPGPELRPLSPRQKIPAAPPPSSKDRLKPEEGLLLRQCEHLGKRLLGKSIGLNMEEFVTKMAAKAPRGIRMDQISRILPLVEDFAWLSPDKKWFTFKNRMNKYNPVVHRIQEVVAQGKTSADSIYKELGEDPGLRGRLVPKALFPKFLSLLPGIQNVARKTQGREDKLAFLRKALEAVEN